MPSPPQSRSEELANSLSHGVGLVASLVAAPILVVSAATSGDLAFLVGSVVFGISLILLYLASTWYHALAPGRRKELLRRLDHAAIYVLIAGSYTPFTVGALRGAWGWTLFGIVWSAALIGVFLKIFAGVRRERISTAIYLLMGWLVVIAVVPLVENVPTAGIAWLAAGGLAYTGGVVFYSMRRQRYAHFVWHLFVLAGSTCHFFAVLWYGA
jgi:hemolysin III